MSRLALHAASADSRAVSHLVNLLRATYGRRLLITELYRDREGDTVITIMVATLADAADEQGGLS